METGLLPRLNTGIAHKDPGVGRPKGVGAGLLQAPAGPFQAAFVALQEA
jgi:hypothetical protein